MEINWRIVVFLVEITLSGAVIIWLHTASRGQRPPFAFLFKLLGAGAASALLAAFFELRYVLPQTAVSAPYLITYNLAVSLIEELAKYFVAVLLILHSRYLRKLSDGIFYMIVIGLGFSLLEDAFFLVNPQTIAGYRLLSFYVHSGTSAIIGYNMGRFHFDRASYYHLVWGLLGAISLHLAYNLTTYVYDAPLSGYLTFCLAFYISLQIFILFRKAVIEEFHIEHIGRIRQHTKLLHVTPGTGQI